MRKAILTMMMMGVMFIGMAQRQNPLADFYPSEMLYEQLTPAQVEQMRTDNPAELLRMNYTMSNFAMVVSKPIEENTQEMGSLEKYLPKGMTYDEEAFIRVGVLNPYKWNLPQDQVRWNVFRMHREGYYVAVPPARLFNEHLTAFLSSYGF